MGGMTEPVSRDWLDSLAEQVNQQFPDGEVTVSSGHSPSGVYHVGTLREIMTANAITWALKRAGRRAKHVDFVDDFDAFRKVPVDVPEEWKKHIGVPLRLVPDPWGDCHESYGDHRLASLNEGLVPLGVQPDEQISGYDNYQQGVFVDQIVASLDRLDEARRILTEVGGRQLDEHWAPVQIMDDNHNLRTRKFSGWEDGKVKWKDREGQTGTVGLDEGKVKLDWRLDWPARWAKFKVTVEPFGRDHATKGGSYDTGAVLVDKLYDGKAPFPVPYEFINSVGQTKKMSKSSGDVLTPKDALDVMPPEILRYFVIGSRPSRTLSFDPGLGLYTLVDEFSKVANGEATAAVAYAHAGSSAEMIAQVPFNHLVAVYQAARQQPVEVKAILERTGYAEAAKEQWPVVERELAFVHNWLEKYAPDSVKFKVHDELPDVKLSDEQRQALTELAQAIEAKKLDGQGMHDAVYAAAEAAGIKASQVFQVIYRALLNQDSGPKAGWFLASLDQEWLVDRLRLSK
ncbi:MAG: Lysyl-tRNA synthetase [Candidatus Saccharibacteria bacterium]|nr:Lysyl-tRNA synthetase [Candidatus Saccharibacteria bacterium]